MHFISEAESKSDVRYQVADGRQYSCPLSHSSSVYPSDTSMIWVSEPKTSIRLLMECPPPPHYSSPRRAMHMRATEQQMSDKSSTCEGFLHEGFANLDYKMMGDQLGSRA